MYIPKRPLNRVGPGTIGREKQQLDAGMTRQPLPHGLGFMNSTIIHDNVQAPILWGGIALLKEDEQFPEQRIRFPVPRQGQSVPVVTLSAPAR